MAAKDRREALSSVAEAVGGTVSEARVPGGQVVAVEHGPWTLTLDLAVTSSGAATTIHTRVMTFFVGREELRLTVRPRTFFDRLADRVGLGGPSVGDREFARRYVAKGTPQSRVRSILSGGLAEALSKGAPLRIDVKRAPRKHRRTMGEHARQLRVLAPGVDTDVERMVGMFDVAREAMDVLSRIGAASSEPPRGQARD